MDLGFGYFVTRFSTEMDMQNVLKGSPWFIVGHILTKIWRWSIDLMTLKAILSFSSYMGLII